MSPSQVEAVGGCNIEPSYQIAAELILLTSSLADEEIPCGLGGHRCHLPDVESFGSQGVANALNDGGLSIEAKTRILQW